MSTAADTSKRSAARRQWQACLVSARQAAHALEIAKQNLLSAERAYIAACDFPAHPTPPDIRPEPARRTAIRRLPANANLYPGA